MSMKQELETWVAALSHYDSNQYEEAIAAFQPIADTSKILFNCGVIRASIGEHEAAVHYYQRAISLDQYLAIAYFQQGVSNFLIGHFEEALVNFNDTLLYLRGNKHIDYEQLGLNFKLHSCEALFNRGLCYIYLQQTDIGIIDLTYAAKEKTAERHNVIDEAIKDKAEGYTVFSIPVSTVFRPHEAKVKNVRIRNYLGKARLVATATDLETGTHRRKMSSESWARDDRPIASLSFASTNMVKPDLRTRQRSAPPLNRNLLPSTPPPEDEIQIFGRNQRESAPARVMDNGRSRSLSRKPEPLDLGAASLINPHHQRDLPERLRLLRSASERPAARNLERPAQDAVVSENQRHDEAPERRHERGRQEPSESRKHGPLNLRTPSRQAWLQRPASIEEEDEQAHGLRITVPEPTSASSYTATPDGSSPYQNLPSRSELSQLSSRRQVSRVDLVRLKVHHGDDTRYFTIQPTASFAEVVAHTAKKFGSKQELKFRTKDEDGDMITMADEEDLETAIAMSVDEAVRARRKAAKLEVWVQEG